MLIVKSNMRVLLARKETKEGRTISLREVQRETGAPMSSIMGLANNTMQEIPVKPLAAICMYLECQIGDLLTLEAA